MRSARASLVATLLVFFAQQSFADVRGTVISTDGAPVAGARIFLYQPQSTIDRIERYLTEEPWRTPIGEGTADADGDFSIKTPKGIRVVEIEIHALGYLPRLVSILDGDDAGAIATSSAPLVWGSVTANGDPVEGARVILSGSDGAETIVVTDEEGRYRVPNPEEWADQIRVIHPDFALRSEARSFGKLPLDHSLESGTALGGRVLGPDGETPVVGASLLIDGWPAGLTGDDGSWEIAHAPKDWKQLVAKKESRIGVLARASKTRDIRLDSAASLSGTIVVAKAKDTIAGATVVLARGRIGGIVESTIADDKGRFSFDPILPGNYRLSVDHPASSAEPVSVSIRPAARETRTIATTATGTITGFLVDEDDKTVSGGVIKPETRRRGPFAFRFPGSGREPKAWSATDGRFILRGVSPDETFDLAVEKTGFPSVSQGPFDLFPGERESGVIITMPGGILITGTVSDDEGEPIAGVSVSAEKSEGGPGFGGRRVMRMIGRNEEREEIETDEAGHFEIRLKAGKYDFSFRRFGYAPKRTNAFEVQAESPPIEVELSPGVELKGRVVRASGIGVPEVMINAMGSEQMTEPVVTEDDGSFIVSDLVPGTVMLIAVKPEDNIQEMRSAKVPGDEVVIELPETGRIEGQVLEGSSGAPVTDFEIGPSGDRGAGGIRINISTNSKTFHADDGHFALEGIPSGEVALVVDAPGFLGRTVRGLQVEAGKTLGDVEIKLERGVRVSGIVTGPDGAPLSGVTVATEAESSTPFPLPAFLTGAASATTDATGTYSMEGVEPGEATITFRKEGYLPERKSADISGEQARLDARLSKGKEVHGQVVTEAGQPVAGADVRARSSVQDSGWNFATTDGSGSFTFTGLTPGRYTFQAEKQGYVEGSVPDVDIESMGTIRITLGVGGTIRGRVLGLSPKDFPSVTVMARGTDSNGFASVDLNGEFRIDGAPTGSVRVSASLRAMFDTQTTPDEVIDVAPGSEANVDLVFDIDTVVTGRVTRDGGPVKSGFVSFIPVDRAIQTRGSANTDGDGNYEVRGLEDGEYEVAVVDLQTFNPFETRYEVHGSGTFDIAILGGTLSGVVVDADTGEPLTDAVVSLENPGDTGPARRVIGDLEKLTDASGAFEFRSVPEGIYTVRAEKKDYGHDLIDVRISERASESIRLELQRNDGVILKIVDARDGRPLAASVWLQDGQGRTVYDGRPTPRGDGTIRVTVAPGAYRGVVSTNGYAPVTMGVTSPMMATTVGLTPGGSILVASSDSRSRTARLIGADGQPLLRTPRNRSGQFVISPGTTRIENVPAGGYLLQVVDASGNVESSAQVVVQEGREARVDL